jgi:hypothetical protein
MHMCIMADAGIVNTLSGTRREPVPGPKSSETFAARAVEVFCLPRRIALR